MRSLLSLPPLLAALAVAGCDAPTAPAFAVTTNEYDKGFEDVAVNDCNGEELRGIVRAHVVNTTTDDGAGGFHETFHLNATGKVLDATNTRYVFHQIFRGNFNGKAGEEQTILATFTLSGQGGAQNELATFRLHFTITPSGAVTVDFVRGDLVCRYARGWRTSVWNGA